MRGIKPQRHKDFKDPFVSLCLRGFLISVVLLYALVLLIGPIFAIAWGALANGVIPFLREVTTPESLSALKLTFILGVLATVINTGAGIIISWLLVRDRLNGLQVINGLIDLPLTLSPVIVGLMLILLFGRMGLLIPVSDALGIKIVFALPGMLLVTLFVSLPFVIRQVMPVLKQFNIDQENAAYTMRASQWQTFWRITFPHIRWALLYGVSLTFARTLGEFGAVLVVSGGVRMVSETATLYIFRSLDDRNYQGAYSMALVLALISFVIFSVIEVTKGKENHKGTKSII